MSLKLLEVGASLTGLLKKEALDCHPALLKGTSVATVGPGCVGIHLDPLLPSPELRRGVDEGKKKVEMRTFCFFS